MYESPLESVPVLTKNTGNDTKIYSLPIYSVKM